MEERYEELLNAKIRLDILEDMLVKKDSVQYDDLLLVIGTERAINRIEELRKQRERTLEEYRSKREEE